MPGGRLCYGRVCDQVTPPSGIATHGPLELALVTPFLGMIPSCGLAGTESDWICVSLSISRLHSRGATVIEERGRKACLSDILFWQSTPTGWEAGHRRYYLPSLQLAAEYTHSIMHESGCTDELPAMPHRRQTRLLFCIYKETLQANFHVLCSGSMDFFQCPSTGAVHHPQLADFLHV